MPTVREYYDITAKALNANREWHLRPENQSDVIIVLGKISYNIEENSKYWSFYIPSNADLSCIEFLLNESNVKECIINKSEPEQVIGFVDNPERQSLSSFHFTRRIYLYIENTIDESTKNKLISFGQSLNFDIKIRDKSYINTCTDLAKPLAFISHDSRDKDSLVRELANELNKLMCPVWYDEFSLKVGDSLREKIETGLKETKNCIIILSPDFLKNEGWGKREFDLIYTREIIEKNNVILPIWHNVNVKDVYDYSPILADKVGLNSSVGVKTLAKKLAEVIKST